MNLAISTQTALNLAVQWGTLMTGCWILSTVVAFYRERLLRNARKDADGYKALWLAAQADANILRAELKHIKERLPRLGVGRKSNDQLIGIAVEDVYPGQLLRYVEKAGPCEFNTSLLNVSRDTGSGTMGQSGESDTGTGGE